MRTVYIDHHFPHHGKHAGYKLLATYTADEYKEFPNFAHRWLKPISDAWLFRFPPFHPNWYNREALGLETEVAMRFVTGHKTVFHFLYGEHSFRWSGRLNHLLGHRHRLVATYHQLPQFFLERRKTFFHLVNLDAVILVASNQREFFDNLVCPDKVYVIPHGVDTQFFRPFTQPQGTKRPLRCISVGSNYRSFHQLVQVIQNINRSRWSGVEFVVVGESDCGEYFRGLNNVQYRMRISDRALLQCYQAADILLLPLKDATACNTLLEGMACGLTAVVTDVGGVRDYVDETCAVLVANRNTEVMTDQLMALFDDEDRRIKMGELARQRAVSRFAWRRIAPRIQRVYSNVWQMQRNG